MMLLRGVITVSVLGVSLWLLFTRRVRYDLVGVVSALILVAAGAVTPSTLLHNLSSVAVVVLAAAMIIAGVLSASGVLDVIGDRIASSIGNEHIAISVVLVMLALASGFVSDVALMLSFIPVVSSMASRFKKPIARYLLALSYAAIAGGRYTMIGTSSNVILESLWIDRFGRSLGLFAPFKVGIAEAVLVAVVSAVVVPLIVTPHARRAVKIEETGPREYFVEVVIPPGSSLDGASVRELEERLGVRASSVRPGILSLLRRRGPQVLSTGTSLIVRVPKDRIPILLSEKDVKTKMTGKPLYELLVTSDSPLANSKIDDVNSMVRGIKVVGVWTNRASWRESSLGAYTLSAGDVILVEGEEEAVARAASAFSLIPVSGVPLKALDKRLAAAGLLGLLVAVIGSLAGVNMALSFLAGAFIAVFLAPSLLKRVYSFVDWSVIVFVGTYMTVGQALVMSGIAGHLTILTSYPLALFGVSLLLANLVGNVATVSVLGPLAVYSPHPLASVIAVSMGASSTFLTPASHPANMIAYSMAGYDAKEFLKAGSVAIAIVVTLTVLLLR